MRNNETGETWECHGGKFTKQADESEGRIQYFDYEIPEGTFVADFGFSWTEKVVDDFTVYDWIGFNW